MKPETAAAAARWWADHLERPDEVREEFRGHLQRMLESGEPRKYEDYKMYWRLEVDYDPSATLKSALHAAGVECRGFMWSAKGLLPLKTWMKIYRDPETIIVSVGRGGPLEHIHGPPLPEHSASRRRRYRR